MDPLSENPQGSEGKELFPKNSQILFLFDRHAIDKVSEVLRVKEDFKQTFRNLFNKSGKNVVFIENAYEQEKGHDELLQEGFDTLKSLRKGAIYAVRKLDGKEPSEHDYEIGISRLNQLYLEDPNSDPIARYTWATETAIDELIEGGYEIDVVYERSQSPVPDSLETLRQDEGTDWVKILNQLWEDIKERNVNIAKQIEGIFENNGGEKPINLGVVLGVAHIGVTDLLPERFRAITTIHNASEKLKLLKPEKRRRFRLLRPKKF